MGNSSVNLTHDLYSEAAKINGTPQMKMILILQCIFGILAIIPNTVAIVLLFPIKAFHTNLRLLLGHLNLGLILYSVTIVHKAFHRLFTPSHQLPILFKSCVMQDWAVMAALHNAMFSLLVLFLERLYSTIRYRTYDCPNERPYLSLGLLFCSWVCTWAIEVANYLAASPSGWVSVCDTNLFVDRRELLRVFAGFVTLESSAIALMIFVFKYNQVLLKRVTNDRAKFDLSCRFTLDQNVKVNAALLPSAVLHAICYLPNNTSLLFGILDTQLFPIESQAWFLHLTFLWRLVYACLHPIILIAMNRNLKRQLLKSTLGKLVFNRKNQKVNPLNKINVSVTHAHFDYLQKMWDDDYAQKRKKSAGGCKQKVARMKASFDDHIVAWSRHPSDAKSADESGEGNVNFKMDRLDRKTEIKGDSGVV